MNVYLWLCCEGWVRFGPYKWLRVEDDPRRISDDTGAVVAVYEGTAGGRPVSTRATPGVTP